MPKCGLTLGVHNEICYELSIGYCLSITKRMIVGPKRQSQMLYAYGDDDRSDNTETALGAKVANGTRHSLGPNDRQSWA